MVEEVFLINWDVAEKCMQIWWSLAAITKTSTVATNILLTREALSSSLGNVLDVKSWKLSHGELTSVNTRWFPSNDEWSGKSSFSDPDSGETCNLYAVFFFFSWLVNSTSCVQYYFLTYKKQLMLLYFQRMFDTQEILWWTAGRLRYERHPV